MNSEDIRRQLLELALERRGLSIRGRGGFGRYAGGRSGMPRLGGQMASPFGNADFSRGGLGPLLVLARLGRTPGWR